MSDAERTAVGLFYATQRGTSDEHTVEPVSRLVSA